jgi:hypothetical protein
MSAPSVFISYSHDSQAHKLWVMSLATRLRKDGVDAIFDQWELGPGADLPLFMEKAIAKSSRVIMVCTANYIEKANLGSGGVGYEKMIVTADLLKDSGSNLVIPILKDTKLTPNFLGSKYYIDFTDPSEFEIGYDQLLRELLGSPLFVKPPLGSVLNFSESTTPKPNLLDPVSQLLIAASSIYERSDKLGYLEATTLQRVMGTSKLYFDYALDLANQLDLIHFSGSKEHIKILPSGRAEMIKLASQLV